MLFALQLLAHSNELKKVIANNPRKVETTANSHTRLRKLNISQQSNETSKLQQQHVRWIKLDTVRHVPLRLCFVFSPCNHVYYGTKHSIVCHVPYTENIRDSRWSHALPY